MRLLPPACYLCPYCPRRFRALGSCLRHIRRCPAGREMYAASVFARPASSSPRRGSWAPAAAAYAVLAAALFVLVAGAVLLASLG